MGRTVSIIAYHYVRDLEASRYPRIKARRTQEFVNQVRILRERFIPITMEQLQDAIEDPAADLPDDAVLLTFDDGYSDHYANVAPVLVDFGMQGSFFVPAQPVRERRVMPVNKIHFILASIDDEKTLLETMFAELDCRRGDYALDSNGELFKRYAEPNRYDSAAVTFTKRMLQNVLPVDLRTEIVDKLFAVLVTADEDAFAEQLYMNADQVRDLRASGMHVGGHGYSHSWMDSMTPSVQAHESDLTRVFLESLGCDRDSWTMCYPYGRWNSPLVEMLKRRGCWAAFTMSPRVADVDDDAPLCLPRLDTNDFPM